MSVMKKPSSKIVHTNKCIMSRYGCLCGHDHWQLGNKKARKAVTKRVRSVEKQSFLRDSRNGNV